MSSSCRTRASFPSSHPLYRGAMTRSQPGVREVLDRHDLLFSVGGDMFTWSLPSKIKPMPPGMPLIHLDTDPWQIGKNYPAEVGILGDPKATLARHHRRGAAAHDRRRQDRAPTRVCKRDDRRRQERARRAARQGARAGRQDAGAAARAARGDRRDAAEGRGGDRGNPVVGAGRALADQQRRRAELLRRCAAAASAGACRPRSASSSRCPTGRWCR